MDAAEGELGQEVAEEAVDALGGRKLAHGAEEEPGTSDMFAALLFQILT